MPIDFSTAAPPVYLRRATPRRRLYFQNSLAVVPVNFQLSKILYCHIVTLRNSRRIIAVRVFIVAAIALTKRANVCGAMPIDFSTAAPPAYLRRATPRRRLYFQNSSAVVPASLRLFKLPRRGIAKGRAVKSSGRRRGKSANLPVQEFAKPPRCARFCIARLRIMPLQTARVDG